MTANRFVAKLFGGPLDVVADVHGEIEALGKLLHTLGYDEEGQHPQNRRLVFLGDLTDRGPDSPAVLDLVERLVGRERAQLCLGNHELALLLGQEKASAGNLWYFGKKEEEIRPGKAGPQVLARPDTKERARRLCEQAPLALERDDLRVVHACWDARAVEIVRGESTSDSVESFYSSQELRVREELARLERDGDVSRILGVFGTSPDRAAGIFLPEEEQTRPPEDRVQLLRERILDESGRKLAQQNWNPVKLLTSGPERRLQRPITVAGKERSEGRVPWWDSYRGTFCVFGHYWRWRLPNDPADDNPFDDSRPFAALGNGDSICIDYSVGRRWRERPPFGSGSHAHTALAALRWPERVVYLDTGAIEALG